LFVLRRTAYKQQQANAQLVLINHFTAITSRAVTNDVTTEYRCSYSSASDGSKGIGLRTMRAALVTAHHMALPQRRSPRPLFLALTFSLACSIIFSTS